MTDLREAVDGDADHLADLIGGVYAEYEGCVLDLDGVDRDLTAIRSVTAAQGGRLWVLPGDVGIAACVGYAPHDADPTGALELKRLYVAKAVRGHGLGGALVEEIVAFSGVVVARTLDLWSDTRFVDGHRLYERFGFEHDGHARLLHDPSHTEEFHFVRAASTRAPETTVTWDGPDGITDEAELRTGLLGAHLHGVVTGLDGHVVYDVTVDEHWRPRHLVVTVNGTPRLRLSSDALGHWWRDGRRMAALDGATDVDLPFTPATNVAPVRRAVRMGTESIAVQSARLAWPSLDIERVEQHYARKGLDEWEYRSPTWQGRLYVDEHGLARRYGDDVFVAR